MLFAKKESKVLEDTWPGIGYLTQSSVLRGPKRALEAATIVSKYSFTDSVLIQAIFIHVI